MLTRRSALAAGYRAPDLSRDFPASGAPATLLEGPGRHALAGRNQYTPLPGERAERLCAI
jgi:methionine aminotransferase